MCVCWYCYWGWPKQIKDIYDDCVKQLDGVDYALQFGPAHVVWSDENFHLAQSCLDDWVVHVELSTHELAVVRQSLERLREVPDEFKCEPAGYGQDCDHPENYPPPDHWEMSGKR